MDKSNIYFNRLIITMNEPSSDIYDRSKNSKIKFVYSKFKIGYPPRIFLPTYKMLA